MDMRGGKLQKVAEDGGQECGGWGSGGGGASLCQVVPAEGRVGEEPTIQSAQECRGEWQRRWRGRVSSPEHQISPDQVMAKPHGVAAPGERIAESGTKCQVERPLVGCTAVRLQQELKTGCQPISARWLYTQMKA